MTQEREKRMELVLPCLQKGSHDVRAKPRYYPRLPQRTTPSENARGFSGEKRLQKATKSRK